MDLFCICARALCMNSRKAVITAPEFIRDQRSLRSGVTVSLLGALNLDGTL